MEHFLHDSGMFLTAVCVLGWSIGRWGKEEEEKEELLLWKAGIMPCFQELGVDI